MIFFISMTILAVLLGGHSLAWNTAVTYWLAKLMGDPTEDEIVSQRVAEGHSESAARGYAAVIKAQAEASENSYLRPLISPNSRAISGVLFPLILLSLTVSAFFSLKWYWAAGYTLLVLFLAALSSRCMPPPSSPYYLNYIVPAIYASLQRAKSRNDQICADLCSCMLKAVDDLSVSKPATRAVPPVIPAPQPITISPQAVTVDRRLFYISTAGLESGPFLLSQLQTMWAAGSITAVTYCWAEGMAEWRPVAEVVKP